MSRGGEEAPRFRSINDFQPGQPLESQQGSVAPGPKVLASVPPDISARLIQTYFKSVHPLWPILYKPSYASLEYAILIETIPPALLAAIFAIAACIDKPAQYSANSIVQRYPEPWQFFEESLELLQYGSDGKPQVVNALTPSITGCQVLTILSLQQHGVAEYSRAAILCGLAAAMAIELRLHRPCESTNPVDREVRYRLWWNLYILEKMMSTEMGRPAILRYEEADCPFPSVNEADEFELMTTRTGSNTSIKLRTLSGLHTTIELSFIMEKICREVYGISARKEIRANPPSGEAKRVRLWHDLQKWESDMDASPLKLDFSPELNSVPASVTNYVICWHGSIMLNRPFIARWQGKPSEIPSPLELCFRAATNICLVLEKYFDHLLGLPCDMVFSVFTAASTLLYHSKHVQDVGPDARRHLRLCIRWLSILGKSWKSAGARHQLLADMYDLPRELQQPPPGQVPIMSHSQVEQQIGQAPPFPRMAANGKMDKDHAGPEDWTFLRSFGDSNDDFYSLDVELRGLLDSGIEVDNSNLAG
jgi:hypothetical protein